MMRLWVTVKVGERLRRGCYAAISSFFRPQVVVDWAALAAGYNGRSSVGFSTTVPVTAKRMESRIEIF